MFDHPTTGAFSFGTANLTAPLRIFFDPTNRGFYLYLLTSLLVAVFLHLREVRQKHESPADRSKALEKSIFPKEVYTHPSAKVDYFYFITNAILYSIILAPIFMLYPRISYRFRGLLEEWFGPGQQPEPLTTYDLILYTIVITLLFDFALFISHFMSHKVPFFWEFHKVHHSAEVMTPITVYRMHPVDDIVAIIFGGVIAGIGDAVYRYTIAPEVGIFFVQGLNVSLFLFYIFAYHLRHSHVWFSYGPFFSKIFISPAQHQIHHSTQRKHWDTNFGFIFSFWDGLFRCLYVPKEREQIQFGIGNGFEDREYSSVLRLYFLPFKKAFRVLFKGRKK